MPDAPDWVEQVQVVVIVEDEPVNPTPANERAAGGTGNYNGTDTTYQSVVSWTVATGKVGELKEIMILSDDYEHTLVNVDVGSISWADDWSPTSSMPIIFEDLRLVAGTIVKVEAKSSDGTEIDVDAIIVAKETG